EEARTPGHSRRVRRRPARDRTATRTDALTGPVNVRTTVSPPQRVAPSRPRAREPPGRQGAPAPTPRRPAAPPASRRAARLRRTRRRATTAPAPHPDPA